MSQGVARLNWFGLVCAALVSAIADAPRWRPALLPASRWARLSLLALILFTLLRSVLWASIQPAFLAPDEDYHFLYINHLVIDGSVPDLHKGNDSQEYEATVSLSNQGLYLAGPRTQYTGAPHAMLAHLRGLSRRPAPPPPRGVLEAPAYYVGGALLDNLLWSRVSVTRLAGLRYYSAVLGALTVFFTWLLAAQILAREWQQLAAAAVPSVQMILAFSASIVSNDVGVAVTMTATLAWCAWMLRSPPQARQGIVLGVLLSISLLTKATELSLLLVVAVALAVLWRTYPEDRRRWLRVVGWTVVIPLLLAGWWYVYLRITTHSFLGSLGGYSPTPTQPGGPGLSQAPEVARLWFDQVYRNYWFTFLFDEVPSGGFWFYVPAVGIVIVVVGLLVFLVRTRFSAFTPAGATRRGGAARAVDGDAARGGSVPLRHLAADPRDRFFDPAGPFPGPHLSGPGHHRCARHGGVDAMASPRLPSRGWAAGPECIRALLAQLDSLGFGELIRICARPLATPARPCRLRQAELHHARHGGGPRCRRDAGFRRGRGLRRGRRATRSD